MSYCKTAALVIRANLENTKPRVSPKKYKNRNSSISTTIEFVTSEMIKKYKPLLQVFYFD